MKNKILLLLLFLIGFSGFAQERKSVNRSFTYRYYGIRDGLLQQQVFYSFQDSFGYIWFATFDGVSRFDGKIFQNYTNKELTAESKIKYINQYENVVYFVSSNAVIFKYPDESIVSYQLPDRYGITQQSIEASGDFLYMFNCHQPEKTSVRDLYIFTFDLKNKTFKRIDNQNPRLIMTYISENYIIANSWDLFNLEPGRIEKVTVFKINGADLIPVQTFDREPGFGFMKSSRNEVFSHRYNPATGKIDLHTCSIRDDTLVYKYITSCPKGDVHGVVEHLDAERLFIGIYTDRVGYRILDGNQLTDFPIPTFRISHVMSDKDGSLWISTDEGIYNYYRLLFETYSLGLSHNDNIWNIRKDCYGNTWFSSYGLGFWKVDKQGIIHPAQVYSEGKRITEKYAYMGSCEDESGKLYLPHGSGIAVFDPGKGNTNRLDVLKTGVSLATFYDTLTRSVFFGGRNEITNLNRLDSEGNLTIYPFDNRNIITICRDAGQRLRIGTYHRDAFLDETEGKVVSDTTRRDYKELISMTLDNKGFLWKGTTDGLFVEDQQGKDTPISDASVNFVLCYKDKYVIWGYLQCLYILDLAAFHKNRTIAIRTFDVYSGFDMTGCGQNGGYIDPDGWVWLVGANEVIRFLPDRLMKISPTKPTKPYIAAIYNADKNRQWLLIDHNQNPLVFENDMNYLRFEILQAAVANPEKLVFRYRLIGYQTHRETTRDRSIIIQNIPHGKYRLEIQSSIDGEEWSESVFSPDFIIKNPFFLTFPGILIILIGSGLMLGILIYFVRKTGIRKQEEMRKIDQMKLHTVQAKFIPHFTGNVLNSINYLITKNPDSAQRYISDFAEFSYQTLLNSDNLSRTIREELDYSLLYLKLEKLRFEENLEYEISVDPETDLQKPVPTMVLQTFCENALKHGLRPKPGGGKIRIRIYPVPDYVALTVEDNGIGREKAQTIKTEGTKEGLKIVQQQLEIFNKRQTKKAYFQIIDLYDENNQPSGTRVELYVA